LGEERRKREALLWWGKSRSASEKKKQGKEGEKGGFIDYQAILGEKGKTSPDVVRGCTSSGTQSLGKGKEWSAV